MRSDMDDMPIEAQTPENIICCLLDDGGVGERILNCLDEFGFEVSKKSAIAAKDAEILALRAAWTIAEPHLPPAIYRRALAAIKPGP